MKQINIKVDDSFYDMAKSKADGMGISMSNMIRTAVEHFSTNGKESVHNTSTNGTEPVVEKAVEALQTELDTKNKQISELHQLLAMSQKLSDRLSGRLEAIEDLRQRPWWKRMFSR